MKKIITLMLTLACALFVGVSCSSDPATEPTNPYDVVITVVQPAEFDAAGAEGVELVYSLSKVVAGESLVIGEPSANWLSVDYTDEEKILLTVDAYNAAGLAPRTATFTIGYKGAQDVVVKVSQKSQEPAFAVAWSNQTPASAIATITILDTTKEGMIWGAFTFGQSALEPSDDFMPWSTRADAATKTPAEYAVEQLALLTNPDQSVGYGFPGLYTAFYSMPNYGKPYFISELNETVYCSTVGQRGWDMIIEEKAYLAVIGIDKKDSNIETGVDNSTSATAIHIFEIENSPAPAVNLSVSEVEVNAAEGCQPVTITVENPCDGELSAYVDYSAESWVTPSVVDNKLQINYAANPYAVSRSATVTVTYSYTCEVMQYGMLMPMDMSSTATVKITQEANQNAENVTFNIEVVETHFDHIVVNVTPSNLETTYVLGNVQQLGFDDAYKGDWSDYAVSQASNDPYTGVQTGLKLEIEDYDKSDDDNPESWKYWVYAYAVVDGNVAGDVSKTLVQVNNDAPSIVCPEGFSLNDGTFNLDVYGKGGEYSIKLEVENAPADGYTLKLYDSSNWSRADEIVVEDDTLNHAILVFGNDQKVSVKDGYLKFTVNDFPADWEEEYDPFASFSLYLTDKDNTKVIANYTVRVRLHPAK